MCSLGLYLFLTCTHMLVHEHTEQVQVSAWMFPVLQKKMDFKLKVVGGDISAIPGLDDAIQVCTTHC